MNPLSRFTKSASFAAKGLSKAWRNEANLRWEILAAIVVIGLAFYLNLSGSGIAVIILTCTLVISLELLNTMIELISDVLKPRLDHYVAQIKDMTAAAVAVAALGALGVAACLLLPPIVHLLWP